MKASLHLLLSSVIAAAAATGCASVGPPANPESTYLDRAAVHVKEAIVVTASVLDQSESREFFTAPLNLVGIQPVWLRIENLSAYSYVLFLKSIDHDYFSPYEAARRVAAISNEDISVTYPKLRDQEVQRVIPPGAVASGFVYTHLDEGLKAFKMDLVGNRKLVSFDIAVEIPGLVTDYSSFNANGLYYRTLQDLNETQLRSWIESLTCCTISEGGVPGDPINVVFVGKIDDIRAALVRQGWDVTAKITPSSIYRIASAFIFGSRYRYAPISGLYLFGRIQDMTFQKSRAAIDERNHIRLWLAPVSYEGTPVWVGHISRDAGIKFSGRVWPPTTHVIDPAVDEARFYLEQDLIYSRNVRRFGLVEGVGAAAADAPRYNAEGDPYFTDGLRAVFFIDDEVVPLDDVEVMNWALPDELEPFRESIFLPPRNDR